MRKILSAVLLLGVLLPLSGQRTGNEIVCTTFPLYIFTKNLVRGVPGARPSLLIAPGRGCPHDYALTPKDMRQLAKKNILLIRNGAGLDDFVLKVMKKVNPSAPILDSSSGLTLLPAAGSICKEHSHHGHHGHHHHHKCPSSRGNPHLFASPFTAEKIVKNIADFLCKNDAGNAPRYRKNEALYRKKLSSLSRLMAKRLSPFAGAKLIAQHNVFDYLAHYTGLKAAGHLSFGSDAPGARRLGELAKMIRKEKIKVILTEPQYPDGSAKRLARECKIKVVSFDPVATGPANAPLDYYEKVMIENLKRLEGALKK